MKAKTLLLFYFLVASIELFSELKNIELIRYLFKPMLMPILMAFVIIQCKEFSLQIPSQLIYALFFSFLGDVMLLYTSRGEHFFMLGLLSFLIAHVFYILLFLKFSKNNKIEGQTLLLFTPMLIFAGALLYFVRDNAGSMFLPVCVYAMVLVALYIASWFSKSTTTPASWKFIMIGTLLFILSDSLIAVQKFILPFPYASFCIMLTYIVSQYMLVMALLLKQYYHYGAKNK